MAWWLSWLERRPVTAEVVGSNPIRVVYNRIMLYKKNSKPSESENLKSFKSCRRPESNRYGYHYPRDFKSRASASSATAAY